MCFMVYTSFALIALILATWSFQQLLHLHYKWQITMLSLLANVNSICSVAQNFNTNCAEKSDVFGCTNWTPLAYSTDGLSSVK